MNNKCFFSIILPVYNGEEYLAGAIESILSQRFINFELIIIDDGSTDGSAEIAKEFKNKDSRILFVQNPENCSLPTSLNIGHEKATGNYLTWSSHDNILKPHFLETYYKEIQSNGYEIIFSDYDIIDEKGHLKREHVAGPVNFLLLGNYIGASFVYKKEIFEKLNGFNKNLFLVEDHDFFLRASLSFRIFHLNKNLYQYRIHTKSLTNRIQNDIVFSEKLSKGLYRMYENLDFNIGKATKDFILGLYFKNEVLNLYIANKRKIRKNLNDFENVVMQDEKKMILNHTEYLLRLNWLDHTSLHKPFIFFKVALKAPELLFRAYHNKNATLRIIYLSFSKIFNGPT